MREWLALLNFVEFTVVSRQYGRVPQIARPTVPVITNGGNRKLFERRGHVVIVPSLSRRARGGRTRAGAWFDGAA